MVRNGTELQCTSQLDVLGQPDLSFAEGPVFAAHQAQNRQRLRPRKLVFTEFCGSAYRWPIARVSFDETVEFIEPLQCAAIALSKTILGSDDDEDVNIERSMNSRYQSTPDNQLKAN